jgi:hypothetical protein
MYLKPMYLKPMYLKPMYLKPMYLKPMYLKPMVAILDATDVAQVGAVVVIIGMLFNLSEFCSSRRK